MQNEVFYLVLIVFSLISIFILSLKFGPLLTTLIIILIIVGYHFSSNRKLKILNYITIVVIASSLSYSIEHVYSSILKPHQQDRIKIWLSLEKDPEKLESMKRTIAYNLNESEKAISSGGFLGKGFMQGTRTSGKFVPEQHTDYIFSTVGEEWGFVGSTSVVILFVLLILRILYLAEQQKSVFSRTYGYGVASIIFITCLKVGGKRGKSLLISSL